MERFDVCRTKREQQILAPYLLVLSAPQLSHLTTVVVAPLVPLRLVGTPVQRLQPTVQFNGESLVVVVNDLLSVPRNALGPRIGSLDGYHFELTAALDFLFQGY